MKRFIITASKEDKKNFKKRVQNVLFTLKDDWNILVKDESISAHDLSIRRKWIIRQKRPLVTVTGSHNKTIIFGVHIK